MLEAAAVSGLGMLAAFITILAYLRYEERSGSLTAATAVALTTRFATASAADYNAAAGEQLLGIRVAWAPDGAALGAAVAKIRIFGGAVGDEILMTVGASGGTLITTGMAVGCYETILFPQARVLKSGAVSMEGMMTVDMGTAQMSVTLFILTADGGQETAVTVMPGLMRLN